MGPLEDKPDFMAGVSNPAAQGAGDTPQSFISGLGSFLGHMSGNPIISSLAGILLGNWGTNQQFKNNKELMRYQAELNERNWRMTNEYNSPAAQMDRLRAAGLNPNLAMGDTGNASNTQLSYSTPSVGNPASAISQGVGAIRQLGLMDAQEDLLRAQAEETRARIPEHESQSGYYNSFAQKLISDIERNGVLNGLTQVQQDKVKEDIKLVTQTVRLTAQQLANAVVQEKILGEKYNQEVFKTEHLQEEFDKQMKLWESEIRKNYADARQADAMVKFYNEQVRDIVETRTARIANIEARTKTEEERVELMRNEIIAMGDELVEGLYARKNGIVLDEYGNESIRDGAYRQKAVERVMDDVFGWIGRVYHMSTFRGSSFHENYNELTRTGGKYNYDKNGEVTGGEYYYGH